MVAALGIVATGCDDDYTPSLSLESSFKTAYPNAVDVEWDRERGHRVAEFKLPGISNDCEAWFTKSGEWVLTEYKIDYKSLPEAVRTAFETGYGTQTPVDSVYYVERNNKSELYIIETEIVVNGLLSEIYLTYSTEGELLRTWVEVEYGDYIYDYL
jgi:hypothetical protein